MKMNMKVMPQVVVLLLLVLVGRTTSFSPFCKVHRIIHKLPRQSPSSPSVERSNLFQDAAHRTGLKGITPRSLSSSSLSLFPAALIATSGIVPVARTTAILGTIVAVLWKWKRILWPKSGSDPNYANTPVPPGSFGCPWLGQLFFLGTQEKGVGNFWYKKDKLFQGAPIWKMYFAGKPIAVVTGGKNVASFLNQEFDPQGIKVQVKSSLIGSQNLLGISNGKQHAFMRKLVGSAMTPAACNAAVPNLQALSEKQVQKMIQQHYNITMRGIFQEFTLDVAWRQILGLDLQDDDEIDNFHQMVATWLKGFGNLRARLDFNVEQTLAYKAKQFIVQKIEEKIDSLLKHGPDETTMSGMVFATDDDGSSKKLTREQIIDNALLLIVAGSETSASTLTNIMMFLGLNRWAWDKLVQEQCTIQAKFGDVLERDILEKECPYLEAVIKEVLRMRPPSSTTFREALSTKLFHGYQIPKGWNIFGNILLTHIHDPTTYKQDLSHMDPLQGFQPERWLDKQTRPSEDFIPMGAGPRYCLGSTLAYTEMKVFLAVLARTIDFELVKKPEEALLMKRVSILPLPADGVVVNVWPSDLKNKTN